jgi:hypothetical protein
MGKTTAVVFLAIGALAARTLGGAANGGAGAGTISGMVVNAAGRPIRGARVALVPMGFIDPSGPRFAEVDSDAEGVCAVLRWRGEILRNSISALRNRITDPLQRIYFSVIFLSYGNNEF